MPPRKITCQQFIGALDVYLSGGGSANVRARLSAHVERCANCTTYQRFYAATIGLAKESLDDPEPVKFPEELLRTILLQRCRSVSKT